MIGILLNILGSFGNRNNNESRVNEEIIRVANAVSSGDREARITADVSGADKEVVDSLNAMLDTINTREVAVTNEVLDLVNAAVEGKLDRRANVEKFEGNYRSIVEGPLNVAAEYVDRISKGDVPELITDEYKGDFNEVKNNLNVCIGALNELVADANMVAEAGAAGKLDIRADVSKHGGDFATLIGGVNNTLDAVVGVQR